MYGESTPIRKLILRSFMVISAARGVPGLADSLEQFIFTQVNLACGATFAINSKHMCSSKHSSAKFELSRVFKFQDAKFDSLVGPNRTVICTERLMFFKMSRRS